MRTNKPKFSLLVGKYGAKLAIITLSLATTLAPWQVFAKDGPVISKTGQKEASLAFAGPIMTEEDEAPKPDKVVHAVITSYTSTPGQTDDSPFIAATGKRVHDGMIAANWLPFGTLVKIPALYGDKIFVVEDRMNARYGYGRMDIWMDTTRAEARKFGVKRVDVEVYYVKKVAKTKPNTIAKQKELAQN